MSGDLRRDLGSGLTLRRARRDDTEPLAQFNGQVHRPDDSAEPDRPVEQWTRDLLSRPHPTVGPDRLCWGSDYPVLRRYLTYQQSIEAFRTHCDFVRPGMGCRRSSSFARSG